MAALMAAEPTVHSRPKVRPWADNLAQVGGPCAPGNRSRARAETGPTAEHRSSPVVRARSRPGRRVRIWFHPYLLRLPTGGPAAALPEDAFAVTSPASSPGGGPGLHGRRGARRAAGRGRTRWRRAWPPTTMARVIGKGVGGASQRCRAAEQVDDRGGPVRAGGPRPWSGGKASSRSWTEDGSSRPARQVQGQRRR